MVSNVLLSDNKNPLMELQNLGADTNRMVRMAGLMSESFIAPVQGLGSFNGGSFNGASISFIPVLGMNEMGMDGMNRQNTGMQDMMRGMTDYMSCGSCGEDGNMDSFVDTEIDSLDTEPTNMDFGLDDEYFEEDDSGMDPLESAASDLVDDEMYLDIYDDETATDDDIIGYIVDKYGVSEDEAADIYDITVEVLSDEESDSEYDSFNSDIGDTSNIVSNEYENYGESKMRKHNSKSLSESRRLVSEIDSFLTDNDEPEDINDNDDDLDESFELIGDIAELMAVRYNYIGEERVANKLIDLANVSDSLTESDELDKTERRNKLFDAIQVAVQEYEENVGF